MTWVMALRKVTRVISGLSDDALLGFLNEQRILGDLSGAILKPLPLNYTSRFWRLQTSARTYVIKVFFPGLEDNPLFPTLPEHEASALKFLDHENLAPHLEAFLKTPNGDPLLIYGYQPAKHEEIDVRAAAELVGALAALDNPKFGLQRVPAGSTSVTAQGDAILRLIPGSKRAVNLARLRPDTLSGQKKNARMSLVHRSLCLGTLQASDRGPRLIDWQYAGIGDPVEDICGFLSPGLLTLYGLRPLAHYAEEIFLRHYPDREIIARFERERTAYHWRLAAYCLYRQETLERSNAPASRAYGRALEEEVDLLLRLRN